MFLKNRWNLVLLALHLSTVHILWCNYTLGIYSPSLFLKNPYALVERYLLKLLEFLLTWNREWFMFDIITKIRFRPTKKKDTHSYHKKIFANSGRKCTSKNTNWFSPSFFFFLCVKYKRKMTLPIPKAKKRKKKKTNQSWDTRAVFKRRNYYTQAQQMLFKAFFFFFVYIKAWTWIIKVARCRQ